MRFVFFIYHDEAAWASLPAPERQAKVQQYVAFYQEVEQRGVRETNATLLSSSAAMTVRAHDSERVPEDGPYAETKYQLGGIYIVNCKDMDEALELAKKNRAAGWGAVEVRSVVGA